MPAPRYRVYARALIKFRRFYDYEKDYQALGYIGNDLADGGGINGMYP